MNLRLILLALAAAAVSFGVRAEPETFNIDNTHSFANWELRHIVARTRETLIYSAPRPRGRGLRQ